MNQSNEAITVATNPSTPPDALMVLARDPDKEVRQKVATNPSTPPDALMVLARDPDEDVRLHVASNPLVREELLAVQANDPYNYVREWAASNPLTPQELVVALADDQDEGVRKNVARNPLTPPEVLMALAGDSDRNVRLQVVTNPSTTPEVFVILAGDPDEGVRREVARNPSTPPDALTVLASDPVMAVRRWEEAKNPLTPAEVLEVLASHPEDSVRQEVAKNPSTPPKVLVALATDPIWDVLEAVVKNPSTPPETSATLANTLAATGQWWGARGTISPMTLPPADAESVAAETTEETFSGTAFAQERHQLDLSRWQGNATVMAAIDSVVEQLAQELPHVLIQRIGVQMIVERRDDSAAARAEQEIALRRIEALEEELEEKQVIIAELEARNAHLTQREVNGEHHDRSVHAAILFVDVAGYSELSDDQKEGIAFIVWGVTASLKIDKRAMFVSNTWGDAAVLALESNEDALNAASSYVGALNGAGHHARVAVHWGSVKLVYNPARGSMDLVGKTVDRAARLEPMIKQLGDDVSIAVTERFYLRFADRLPPHFRFNKAQVKVTKSFAGHLADKPFACYAVSDLRNSGTR